MGNKNLRENREPTDQKLSCFFGSDLAPETVSGRRELSAGVVIFGEAFGAEEGGIGLDCEDVAIST